MKINEKQKWIKYLLIVAIALIGSIILGLLSWISTPELISEKSMPPDSVAVTNTVSFDCRQCEIKDGNVTITGGDPQILISGIEQRVHTVCIVLKNDITNNTNCTLYYPDKDGNYKARCCDSLRYVGGQENLIFTIPPNTYSELRLDIDDNFELQSLMVSESPYEIAYDVPPNLNPISFVLLFFLIFGIAWFLFTFFQRIKAFFLNQWQRRNMILKGILILCLGAFVGLILGWPVSLWRHLDSYCWQQMIFFGFGGMLLGALWLVAKIIKDKQEIAFAAVALVLGLMFICTIPVSPFITWDDEIHYKNTLILSYCGEAYVTQADYDFIMRSKSCNYESSAEVVKIAKELNADYDHGALYKISESFLTPSNVGLIPAALGLWLGRLVHLPFTGMILLARLMSLLCYITVLYYAIRNLKTGKMLMALVALIPTALFQAVNFTYDSWMIAFLMLAVSLYLHEVQETNTPISLKKEIGIILVFILGCLPKAIYFPIILMMFVMPKEKFSDAQHRKRYYAILAAGTIAIILSLVIPFLLETSGATDSRGGVDVNAFGQMHFILTHPLSYLSILSRYLFIDYLNPINAYRALTYVGYFPQIYAQFPGYIYILLLLLFVTFTECHLQLPKKRTSAWLVRGGIGASVFFSICMVATVLYIAFTGVGSISISGCQGRYLLPLLFAGLCVLSSTKIHCSFHWQRYNMVVLVIMCALICNGLWDVVQLFQ